MDSREYWRQRETENLARNLKTEAEYTKELQGYYDSMMDQIQKEINGFYGKYAKAEGLTLAEAKRRVDKLDIEAYGRKAAKYVKEKNFSKEANEEMRLYNATMKINRLEMLKANIGLELVNGFDGIQKYFDKVLTERALSEFERQAGILGGTVQNNAKKAKAIVNASFNNARYSERIWMYQNMMKAELSKLLQQGLIQGKNPKQLATHLQKLFGVRKSDAERLMRTELARVQTEAQKQSFERNGYDKYEFVAIGNACSICKAINGQVFDVKKMMPGENAPPMHPNCRCSVSAYMDREEFEKWLGEKENIVKPSEKTPIDLLKLTLPGNASKIKGMTTETKRQIENAIRELQEEYTINISNIELVDMGKNDIFGVAPYIDESGKLRFVLALNQNIDYDKVKSKIQSRYKRGRFAGKSIEDYIAHEMAHIMMYQDCINATEYSAKKKIITKQFIRGISSYSDKTQNGEESLAEAFVRYRNNEKIPVKAKILIMTYLERWKK